MTERFLEFIPGMLACIAVYAPPLIVIGIMTGVIGKYVYDYSVRYFKASDKSKVKWDSKGFWLTIVVSFFLKWGQVYV
jgi:hypothetical protein